MSQREENDHIELTPTKARPGARGEAILAVLAVLALLAAIGLAALFVTTTVGG